MGTTFVAVEGPGSETPSLQPDLTGAVGPTQVMVAVNGRIKVFDRNGSPGPINTTSDNFFARMAGSGTANLHVRYDRLSERWFVVTTSFNPSTCGHVLLIAVSSGPTIAGDTSFVYYYGQGLYETLFETTSVGVDAAALYVGADTRSCDGSDRRHAVLVFNKWDLINFSLPFRFTAFTDLSVASPQVADSEFSTGYVVGKDPSLAGRLGIYLVLDPGSNSPSLSPRFDLDVQTTSQPVPQPQPSPGPSLDAGSGQLIGAAIHRNRLANVASLWTAHAIAVDANGDGGSGPAFDRNGSRWYEIGLSATPTLMQSGTLFDAAPASPLGYWIPSVAMSGQGHTAVAASRAGIDAAVGHASVAAAGRLRTDALGVLRTPTLAHASTSIYDSAAGGDPEPWGGRSRTVVDPNDDQTIWTFQEYASSSETWGVRVVELKAPPPATPVAAVPAVIGGGQPVVDVTITGEGAGGSEFFDPGPDPSGPGFLNRIAATVSGGVTVQEVTFESATQVRLRLSTVGAPAGAKNVTITNPDGQSATGDGILTVTSTCPTITVDPATLPVGTAGQAYSQTFTQSGGTAPIAWSLTGTLPTGLGFNTSTGELSGTPTEIGVFAITVTANDTNGCPGTRAHSLVVNAAGAFVPTALAVDAAANSVFEPGETVIVAPSWRNDTGAPAPVSGVVSSFTGPAGPTYTILDSTAEYGSVAPGATASCNGTCYGLSVAGSRPATHWDTTVLETLSGSETKTWTLHVGNSFTDVPITNPFYRLVETLLHKGVTGGCGTNLYCPSEPATREQMAVFVLAAKEGAGYAPPPCSPPNVFADVPETSPFCRFIEELSNRGVVSGCGGGNYCPGDPTTREQMAVFTLRTLDPTLTPPPCSPPNVFADVPETSPFCVWIEELFNRGVVSGCGGGNYCPTDPVTREQMGVLLSVTFGLALYGP